MTVNYKTSNRQFTAGAVLNNHRDLVNDVVIEALASTTETYLDANRDLQDEDPAGVTPPGIMRTLNQATVKAAALEYALDMLDDLKLLVEQRMAAVQYQPVLNSVKYGEDGSVADIVMTVKVTEAPVQVPAAITA